jgi:hypothetical protein
MYKMTRSTRPNTLWANVTVEQEFKNATSVAEQWPPAATTMARSLLKKSPTRDNVALSPLLIAALTRKIFGKLQEKK